MSAAKRRSARTAADDLASMQPVFPVVYPDAGAERDRWILERRGGREDVDPTFPYAFLIEDERYADGTIGGVTTVFLTNRECPFRCTMCDLWQHTLTVPVPLGAIQGQIRYALERLPEERLATAKQIKLYNSGSFFDRGAIPVEDYGAIAMEVRGFERVIVESHPALVGGDCWWFARMLGELFGGQLEVAMGLETAHPEALERLNKRMTLDQYRAAADQLQENGVALRSFVLVQPPFVPVAEALEWACRSIDFAFECGATAVSLLPTRAGNGAVDALAAMGEFVAPGLGVVEDAMEYGVRLGRGRVFVDLWDVGKVETCAECREARVDRLDRMNLDQQVLERVGCARCGGLA